MINQLDEIKDTLFKYLESRLDLFKIETRSRIERAVITAVYAVLLFGIFLVAIMLAMVMIGHYLNEKLESEYLGFVILLGLMILKIVIWIVFKKQVKNVLAFMVSLVMKPKDL
mgnify:CR=1 FL=1|tara:strand:+ start:1405 stop:1743 length:339 start_codon:yes stop_codon:yes gene_type:complete